jgi:hypothetical protein
MLQHSAGSDERGEMFFEIGIFVNAENNFMKWKEVEKACFGGGNLFQISAFSFFKR